jgi:predicted acetyltransferase
LLISEARVPLTDKVIQLLIENMTGMGLSHYSINFEDRRDGDLKLQYSHFAQHPVHRVGTYFFRMVHTHTGEELGNINLRIDSSFYIERYAGHVGFSVHEAHRGHRYAARSLVLLAIIAKKLGFTSLWITCDPENTASRRTLELAGAELSETVDVPADSVIFQSGHLRKCRYRVDL